MNDAASEHNQSTALGDLLRPVHPPDRVHAKHLLPHLIDREERSAIAVSIAARNTV